jgi:hypothetical protein
MMAVCAALTVALGLGSCREDTIISSNVTPSVDNITTFQVTLPDSFYEARTVRVDSIITSVYTSPYQALGWVQQTEDGISNTMGSIYMQVVPRSTGSKFPAGDVLDSAFVILPYAGFTWGDTTSLSSYTIRAYQLNDTLSVGTNYFPFSQKATGTNIIGTGTLKVGTRNAGLGVIADSVMIGSTKVPPHLRVRLDNSVINTLKAATDTNTTFAGFLRAFNGIYLVPDTNFLGRALPYFRIDPTVGNYTGANLLVYAHNTTRDTTYSFPYNATYAAGFNRITRKYSDVSNIFNPSNPQLVMQNQPGAAIDFRFKNLNNQALIPEGAVLNKVEITFTRIRAFSDTFFFGPARIYPQGVSNTGVRYTVLDRYPISTQDGLDFIDGTPRSTAGTITYTLNVPRELQQAITNKESTLHLLIGGTANFPGAYRLILASLTHPDPTLRPLVKIIYSKQQ